MILPEIEAEILRLYHAEKWRVGTIATQLGIHHSTVRRVLAHSGIGAGRKSLRPSMADPFIAFIVETLEKYPRLRASRLYEMVRQRGYPGRPDHFRTIVARYRPRPKAEAYLRLRTLPGEQAQVDWGHFSKLTVGRAVRPLMGFVMVLSWSRHVFLRFYLGAAMANFIRGHVDAFDFYESVPRVILYDNLRSAVLERRHDAIRFHPTLLELAAHYRFSPRPVAVARGNEKGRVERAIRFIRESFFAARSWKDLDDLNHQALQWCCRVAAHRKCPEDRTRSVAEAFAEENPRLLPLPDNPFPTEERIDVQVGKNPYVRFDLNDYSVPHTYVRRTLVVAASLESVRVLDGNQIIATHPRSFGRGEQIEEPAHIQELVDYKREAKEHRGIDRLYHAVPQSRKLFEEVACRGGNLGGLTRGLIPLLDRFGAVALEHAVTEALEHDTPHLSALRHILDRNRHAQGKPPPIAVELPDNPTVRDLVVNPHPLSTYDQLKQGDNPDDKPKDPRP
jgi:transposase